MHTIRAWLTTLMAVALVAVIVVGCGSATAPTPLASSPTRSPTAAVLPSVIPDGIYAGENYKLKLQAGRYTLLTEFDQEWTSGSFTVNGNRITFTEEDTNPECRPEDSPYSYAWSFDGKVLTFASPEDKCLGRAMFMVENQWLYKGETG